MCLPFLCFSLFPHFSICMIVNLLILSNDIKTLLIWADLYSNYFENFGVKNTSVIRKRKVIVKKFLPLNFI